MYDRAVVGVSALEPRAGELLEDARGGGRPGLPCVPRRARAGDQDRQRPGDEARDKPPEERTGLHEPEAIPHEPGAHSIRRRSRIIAAAPYG